MRVEWKRMIWIRFFFFFSVWSKKGRCTTYKSTHTHISTPRYFRFLSLHYQNQLLEKEFDTEWRWWWHFRTIFAICWLPAAAIQRKLFVYCMREKKKIKNENRDCSCVNVYRKLAVSPNEIVVASRYQPNCSIALKIKVTTKKTLTSCFWCAAIEFFSLFFSFKHFKIVFSIVILCKFSIHYVLTHSLLTFTVQNKHIDIDSIGCSLIFSHGVYFFVALLLFSF